MASEEIRFDDWDIDVVLSATQKGLGTPPGLSIVVASPRAIRVYKAISSVVIFVQKPDLLGFRESYKANHVILCELAQVCRLLSIVSRCIPLLTLAPYSPPKVAANHASL